MTRRILDLAVASLVRVWLATSSHSWRRLPRPADEPHVHGAGDSPHRVLVVGSGIAMSYGVLSHQVGFGGHFARQLADRTKRGSDVLLIVDVELTVGEARALIVEQRPTRFDAVVLTFGGAESLRLMPVAQWRHDMEMLLDVLAEHTAVGAETFIIGTAPLGRIVRMPALAHRFVGRRLDELNTESRRVTQGRRHVTYVPFEPPGTDLVRHRDRTTYERWGSIVATAVADGLAAGAPEVRADDHVDETERQFALESLGILDTEVDARFEQITETAKALFGVASASINFIDRDRQWVKAATGGTRTETPRADAFCDVTIQRAGVFVVNDAASHPRFRSTPAVHERGMRFYAGYPIEAPNGMRVGALCIQDPNPRAFSRSDEALLRELALRVQGALWASASA